MKTRIQKNMSSSLIGLATWTLVLFFAAYTYPAQFDESSGVAHRRGDASPSESESRVNDYRFQDEQINITPESGVVKVLRTNQKNLINDYVTDVIPVKNVNTREIRTLMRQICYAEGGRAEVIQDKVGKQQFVQVICPKFQLPYIRAAVAALDRPWVRAVDDGSSAGSYTARFRDVRAVETIAEDYAGEGESFIDLANNSVCRWDEPYRVNAYIKKGAKTVDIPVHQVLLDLTVYEINVANNKKLGLDYIAWKNGPGRNLAEFIISGMDNHERFTNLSSIYNPLFPRVVNLGPRDLRLVREFTADEIGGHANFLLSAAFLDFLASKGKAKILVSTKLLATSGQGRNAGTEPARFEAVENVVAPLVRNEGGFWWGASAGGGGGYGSYPRPPFTPPTLGSAPGPPSRLVTPYGALMLDPATSRPLYDSQGNPRFTYYVNEPVAVDTPIHNRTLEYEMAGKVGVFFEVIPHVACEACELEIQAGVSSVAGYGPDGLPILSQRILSTQLVARNHQPIVLSGLSRVTSVRNNARMPILGKIPILGYLAGGETDVQQKTEVVFVIKPTIITGSESSVALGAQPRWVMALAEGKAKLRPPTDPLGFDQWLLDREAPMP